jgi:hypothetical protein
VLSTNENYNYKENREKRNKENQGREKP